MDPFLGMFLPPHKAIDDGKRWIVTDLKLDILCYQQSREQLTAGFHVHGGSSVTYQKHKRPNYHHSVVPKAILAFVTWRHRIILDTHPLKVIFSNGAAQDLGSQWPVSKDPVQSARCKHPGPLY